jgi:predicted porin
VTIPAGTGVIDLDDDTDFISGNDWTSDDAWQIGLTVDYQITQGLSTKIAVNYFDIDGGDDDVNGFVRLQRAF